MSGPVIPDALKAKATDADARLSTKAGYPGKDLSKALETLFQFGQVEIGWRESCGKTDFTMFVFREWKKIVTALRKNGFQLSEEPIKHGNAWATKCGGFWSSIKYSLVPTVAPENAEVAKAREVAHKPRREYAPSINGPVTVITPTPEGFEWVNGDLVPITR